MFNKYQWKQPIYKEDLKPVLLNGIVFSILGGILAGLADYLCSLIGLGISFGLIIISYFVGKKVRESYYSYHILYPTLTIVFMLIGLLFSNIAINFIIFRNAAVIISMLKPMSILNILISPVKLVIYSVLAFDFINLFISLFNLAMYTFAFIYAYRVAKGRN